VIFGAQDTEFVPETPEKIANYIGAAKPTLITGAGHLSMWAQPQKVADAIFSFIGANMR
jgi:pimeloyl-ACP methyl ester carboxylesterase